jgi:glycine cleavage system H protein
LAAPAACQFSKTHEWAALEGDTATVGITDFAVRLLSDLVYVDLPKPGRKVTAGEPFGEIESVKHVSDLYSPVTGEVLAVNTQRSPGMAVERCVRSGLDDQGQGLEPSRGAARCGGV